jgi:hypothetical protein
MGKSPQYEQKIFFKEDQTPNLIQLSSDDPEHAIGSPSAAGVSHVQDNTGIMHTQTNQSLNIVNFS